MATCSAGADGVVALGECELREWGSYLVRRLLAGMTKGVKANLQLLMIILMIIATRMSRAQRPRLVLRTPPKVTHPHPVELWIKYKQELRKVRNWRTANW